MRQHDERTAPTDQRRTTWVTNVAVILTSLLLSGLVVALMGEWVLRYRERHRTTLPGTMPLLYYQHRRLPHALVRNSDYFGWVRINRSGFRGREVAVRKPDGVYRIMVVGSSTTFDVYVRGEESTWPARLEAALRQSLTGTRVDVINAGVPGYMMLDNLIRLQTELYEYRPDLIILYEGHNDMISAVRRGVIRPEGSSELDTPDELPVVTPWGRWLSRHSLFYAKLMDRWSVMKFAALRRARPDSVGVGAGTAGRTVPAEIGPGGLPSAAYVAGAAAFAHHLTGFLALARNLGIPVLIPELVHVSGAGATSVKDPGDRRDWQNAVPFATPEGVIHMYTVFDSVARVAAERYAATYVPTRPFGLTGSTWYAEGDPIHFNERGSERMGRLMAQTLVALRVLDR